MDKYYLKDGIKDKSWAIANIGIIFLVVYVAIILLSWLFGLLKIFADAPFTRPSAGVLIVMGLTGGTMTAKGTYSGFTALGIIVVFFILGVVFNHPNFWVVLVYFLLLLVSACLSIPIWNFTYENIDQVISRRMRYRKTETQIHEFRWLYATDRLIASSLFIAMIFYEIFHILFMNLFEFYRNFWIIA